MHKTILLFLLLPLVGHCDVFKCVEKGKVTYASQPCSKDAVFLETDNLSVMAPVSFSVNYSRSVGAYVVPAAINGIPVTGMLDTGATATTINGQVAYRLGVKNCTYVGASNTAAGTVSHCELSAVRISFGGFVFPAVTVHVIPSMVADMLIGQDVLSQMRLVQSSGVMTLSR